MLKFIFPWIQKPVDMIKLQVTMENIKTGVPHSPYRCPIALALNCTLGGTWMVGIISAWRSTDQAKFLLGKKAQKFINKIDSGVRVSPITFYVPLSMKINT